MARWTRLIASVATVCAVLGCGQAAGPDAGPPVCGTGADGIVAVPLTGCPILGYGANVTIGSQQFSLLLDTGSTSLIVASSACGDCVGVSPVYSPGSGATDEGRMDTSPFGTGTVQGEVYRDSVQIAGVPQSIPLGFIAAEKQSQFPIFEPIDCQGMQAATGVFQGLMGLGPQDIALPKTQSYPLQLVSAGIEPGVFAVQFCESGGRFWIGGFDATCTTAAPQYTPLVPSPYYAVNIADMGIGGTSLGVSDFGPTVIDTGSSSFILPDDAFQAISAQVAASDGFQAAFPGEDASFFSGLVTSPDPCIQPAAGLSSSQVDSMLPPLTITLPEQSGDTFTLSLTATQSYLDIRTIGGVEVFCPNIVSAADVGGSAAVPTILAHSLPRAYVTIFDVTHGQIGFAPQQGCP